MNPSPSSPAASSAPVYLSPPQNVADVLNAKPTPGASLSPDKQTLLLVDYEAYPPLELLARPFLALGGVRVDPALSARHRSGYATGFTLLSIADGVQTPVTGLPEGAQIGSPVWARNGNRWAFTRDTETGVEVWVGERETAACRLLAGFHVTDILGGPLRFLDDSTTLLVWQVPLSRGEAPQAVRVPLGPVVQETENKTVKASTFQDLLQNPHDEDLFAFYGQSQLAYVNTDTGAILPLGAPDLYTGVRPSPDENYLLVSRLQKPFSYRVPASYFARTTEVWDAKTAHVVRTVANLGVSDQIPQQGVPVGPRGFVWQELHPATLLWVEAQDGGDPMAKVPFRDAAKKLSAPFTEEPADVLSVVHRFSSWDWLANPDDVLVSEYDRDRRWHTTYRLNLNRPDEKTVLFDLSIHDAYADPGDPLYRLLPEGAAVILQNGNTIYLAGRGANPDGDRPFLDAMDLSTGDKTRLWQCASDVYEAFVAFLGDENNPREMLTSRQSRTQPANYFVRNLATSDTRQLTHFSDPHPDLTGMKKELVKYERASDGVPLSGMLYLPVGYDEASGEKLPLILWAYPNEYSDAQTAGQVRGSTNTFTRLGGDSPLWFVTQGYAVLNNATVPVVGDPETMNDNFVEQIVGAAQAAIDVLDKRGLVDPARVLVAGHSYGAFMTANLLAHSDLFAAGIARSGAYNRTLTPFGFQAERRSYWEARDVYTRLSPFTYANQIKNPLLLIHGAMDNNPGTFTVQSERFYQALQANGATARLVLLPFEAHGYRAKESVLHVLAEMFAWADKYVKNRL